MANSVQNTWYTGDWVSGRNNATIPYNGLKIIATANYNELTSPPTSSKLTSVLLDVVDYTYDPNGVSSSFTIYKTGKYFDIPIPVDTLVSPPKPNLNFTVTGTGSILTPSVLGQVKLSTYPSGTFLEIQFSYGPEGRKREEIGLIMKFAETQTAGEDPVEVEE